MPPIGGVRAGYLSAGKDAIPDSGLLHHWDLTQESDPAVLTDQQGAADLSANGNPQLNPSGINGRQSVQLDGTDDFYETPTGAISQPQPFELFFVISPDDTGDMFWHATDQSGTHPRSGQFDGSVQIDAGSVLDSIDSAALSRDEIVMSRFDGSNSEIEFSGTTITTGNAGSDGLGGVFLLGTNAAGVQPFDGQIGEAAIYDPTVSGYSRSEVNSYLSDEWGIAL